MTVFVVQAMARQPWMQPASATTLLRHLDATGALLALDEMWKLQALDDDHDPGRTIEMLDQCGSSIYSMTQKKEHRQKPTNYKETSFKTPF